MSHDRRLPRHPVLRPGPQTSHDHTQRPTLPQWLSSLSLPCLLPTVDMPQRTKGAPMIISEKALQDRIQGILWDLLIDVNPDDPEQTAQCVEERSQEVIKAVQAAHRQRWARLASGMVDEATAAHIASRRGDVEFQRRLKERMAADQHILQRLADQEGDDPDDFKAPEVEE